MEERARVEDRSAGRMIGTGARGEEGARRGRQHRHSGRVLPRANDIVTITVTTYPSTE